MEGKRISQLTPDTSPSTDDYIVSVDGATTQNKRVELGSLPVSNPQNDALDLKLNISDNRVELRGTGFPQGVVSAPVGATYVDTAATNGAIEWVKATGTGNTGWVVSVGNTGRRNITSLCPLVTSGNVYLMRDGNTVTFAFADVVFGTQTGTVVVTPAVPGFTPPWSSFNSPMLHGSLSVKRFQHSAGDARVYSVSSGDSFNGQFAWSTTQNWPTALPGTAA